MPLLKDQGRAAVESIVEDLKSLPPMAKAKAASRP